MTPELVVSRPVADKMTTYGGAFGMGIVLGWVASTRPAWGTAMTLITGAGGAIGSLTLRGFGAEVCEGVGCAAMGALGASLPTMFARRAPALGAPAPKQLPAPTNIVAEAIARQVKSAQPLAQAAARQVSSWAYTPEEARGAVGQGHTVRDYA